MPLDKIENIEEYIKTHELLVLHIKNNPVGCIIEENNDNKIKYLEIEKKSLIGLFFSHKKDRINYLN